MHLTDKEARLIVFLRSSVGLTWHRIVDAWEAYEGEQSCWRDRDRTRQAWGQSLVGMAEEVLEMEPGSTDWVTPDARLANHRKSVGEA